MVIRKLPWILFPLLSGIDLLISRVLLGDEIPYIGEKNPFAAQILFHYGWLGLGLAKFWITLFVLLIAFTLKQHSIKGKVAAQGVLWTGSSLTLLVVCEGFRQLLFI